MIRQWSSLIELTTCYLLPLAAKMINHKITLSVTLDSGVLDCKYYAGFRRTNTYNNLKPRKEQKTEDDQTCVFNTNMAKCLVGVHLLYLLNLSPRPNDYRKVTLRNLNICSYKLGNLLRYDRKKTLRTSY